MFPGSPEEVSDLLLAVCTRAFIEILGRVVKEFSPRGKPPGHEWEDFVRSQASTAGRALSYVNDLDKDFLLLSFCSITPLTNPILALPNRDSWLCPVLSSSIKHSGLSFRSSFLVYPAIKVQKSL